MNRSAIKAPRPPRLVGFVGVDGGATRCRARLRRRDGALLGDAEGPAANIYVDFAAAIAALQATIGEALGKAGLGEADRPRLALGLGLAGLSNDEDAHRVEAAFAEFSSVRAVNDATAACLGAHEGGDGGLVIAGTGSAAIARVGGCETIVGGRGFLIGDDGSGARMGAEAMRAAMRAIDGLGPATRLTDDLVASFGEDPVAMTRWALTAKPGDYGAFAPRVFEFAAADDAVAAEIVAAAARGVAALTRRVLALGAPKVALVGGVGEALRPHLEPAVAAALVEPLHDPTDGAILLVGGRVRRQERSAP